MNIIIRTYSGRTVTRPDTSWKCNDDASYLPEFVNSVSYTPVVIARVCKAGRSVALKFAGRYWDKIGYGVLLYAENLIDGSDEGYASASCLDHSSFLSLPDFGKDEDQGEFRLLKDGREIFRFAEDLVPILDKAVSETSLSCYLRTGDFVIAELAPRSALTEKADGRCTVEAVTGQSSLLSFKLVLD